MRAQRRADGGVVAAQPIAAVALRRLRHVAVVLGHHPVVEHHRHDRDLRPHRGLHVQPGHTERRLAHQVDHALLRRRQLGPDGQPQSVAELCRLAPAEVPARRFRLPHRHQLIARISGVVGDDGVGHVERLLQFADHPIGADRNLVRGEVRFPLPGEFGAHRRHPRRRAVAIAAHPGAVLAAVLRAHLLQHQPGIADRSQCHRVVLADILAAVGHLGERGAGGHRRGEGVDRETGANSDDQVGFGEKARHRQGARQAAGTERERVVLRERALAGQRGHHRHLRQLGERHQFRAGLAVQYALAGHQDRVAGGEQGRHQVAHVLARRGRAVPLHRRVVHAVARVILPHGVVHHLQQHRPAPAVPELAEGAPHHRRHVAGGADLRRPLGDRAVGAHRVERGRHALAGTRRAAGQVQHRHRVGVRLRHAGERVLGAGAVLHGEHPESGAVGHAGISVGDVDAGAFLPADHRSNADLCAALDKVLHWKRGEKGHSLGREDLRHRVISCHLVINSAGSLSDLRLSVCNDPQPLELEAVPAVNRPPGDGGGGCCRPAALWTRGCTDGLKKANPPSRPARS